MKFEQGQEVVFINGRSMVDGVICGEPDINDDPSGGAYWPVFLTGVNQHFLVRESNIMAKKEAQ